MAALSYAFGASAEVVTGTTISDPSTRGGYALVIYPDINPNWTADATDTAHMEPWMASILEKLSTSTAASTTDTEKVTCGTPSFGTGTRDGGTVFDRRSYSCQVYGGQITQTHVDPDDMVLV